MPYPSQVNRARILEEAGRMIAQEGYEALSLAKLAGALGIKAPSLYKHFASKGDLLRALNAATAQQLSQALVKAAGTAAGESALLAIGRAYRQFAHSQPHAYFLAYGRTPPDARPDDHFLEGLALPLEQAWAACVGAEKALPALRGQWALAHGWVTLELENHIRRGGDLDATYEQVMRAYVRGWLGHAS